MRDTTNADLEVSEKKTIAQSAGEPTREGLSFVPDVDIYESAEAITLCADVPGATKDNIGIDVREGVLTLSASVAQTAQSWRPVHREYEVGGFSRRFTLGHEVDVEQIAARLEAGVLAVTLPKAEAHKPRKIEIQ